MNLPTSTLTGLLSLFLTLVCLSSPFAQITVIESQSYNLLHRMDESWEAAATDLGLEVQVLGQSALLDPNTYTQAEVLIVSSGVITLSATVLDHLEQYLKSGKNLYIQGEYLMGAQGNHTFEHLVSTVGGSFKWDGETNGQLSPLAINPIISQQDSLRYYWYGAHGTGDTNTIPLISKGGLDYAFLYCPSQQNYGKIITTSDQDWIRLDRNPTLVREILAFLNRYQPMVVPPQILIDASVSRPCNGENISFSAQVMDAYGYETFQWMVNGQAVPGATGAVWQWDQYEDGDVVECLISVDYGCGQYQRTSNQFLIDPIIAQVADLPVVNAVTDEICEGQAARFWAQVDLRPGIENPQYQWWLNGQPISNATNLNLTINSFQINDSVQFVMTYDNGCQANITSPSDFLGLTVNPTITPQITLTADRTTTCGQEQVTFTVTGDQLGNQPTYLWAIDGQSISETSAIFSTSQLSNGQEVSVRVIPELECPSAAIYTPDPITVTVLTPETPQISIERLGDEICEGDVHSFAANIQNGGNDPTIEWMINGQKTGATGMTFTTNSLLDEHVVTASLQSNLTCLITTEVYSNPIQMELSPLEMPEVRIIRGQSVVCPETPSTFEAIGIHLGSDPSYEWFVDGVAMGVDTSIFTQVLAPGQEVYCQVISSKTCIVETMAVSTSLESAINDLSISIEEIQPASCTDDNGILQVRGQGGFPPYQYQWSHGAAVNRLDDLAAGDYLVTVTDDLGCETILPISLTGETMPQLTELALEQPNCYRSKGTATARIPDNEQFSYEWYNEEDEMVSEDFYAFDLLPGEYELIVSTQQGCTSSYTFEVLPADQLQLQLATQVNVLEGTPLTLSPAIAPTRQPLTYQWFPAEGLSCTDCPNPVATPSNTTIYSLTISTEDGCTSSQEIIVEVTPNQGCFIPNVFSPNGDGENDFFTVYGSDLTEDILRLQIFDRWGNQAFGGEHLPLDLEQVGWDGTLKGQEMPTGVYVYIIDIRYKSGRTARFTGDVTLVR